MVDLIKIITELVSSLPYNNYSIDERQKIYNEWLRKYEKELEDIQTIYNNYFK